MIVIDIPEEVKRKVYAYGLSLCPSDNEQLIKAIINGIPLPKGHGRLIDADKLKSMYSINRANFNTVVGIQKWIDDAPTIIKAESEE